MIDRGNGRSEPESAMGRRTLFAGAAVGVAGAVIAAGAGSAAAATTTPPDWYNVKDYGAVGDGTTVDTTAIQDAIDAAGAAGGGVVYFPAGVYAVEPVGSATACLVLNNGTTGYSGVRLVGDSAGASHIKKLTAVTMIVMGGPATDRRTS